MGIHVLRREQLVNADVDTTWKFFSDPGNLSKITPPYMGFSILSPDLPEQIYPGMLIQYQVSPLLNLKLSWVTEITQVVEKRFFIDEQRFGPYKFWHHQHFFLPVNEGTLIKDIVH